MNYKVYNPEITTITAIDPYDNPSGLTYVSNSSLVYWQGQFWAIMDGTTQGFTEGSTGQQIWLTTSLDGETWQPAYQPFRDSNYCTNPISGSPLEWQPNLVVVGSELWCTWCRSTGIPQYSTYVSKLTSSTGKWMNYRFEYDGMDVFTSTTISGPPSLGRSLNIEYDSITDWAAFPSQNPIVLSSGVLACPVTLVSKSTLSTETTSTSTQIRRLKHNAIYKYNGADWSMVLIDTSEFGDYCAWEPFVVEDPAGYVYCYSRSLNMTSPDPDFLLVAMSTDGMETFSPSKSTKLLVPSTRGFVRQVGTRRWIMTNVDCPQGSDQTVEQTVSNNRINGALFMSRRGVDDFVPGVNFSGSDNQMNYPQFDVANGYMYINYTSQDGNPIRRSLKVVKVLLPEDDKLYIHPRSVTLYNPENPTDPVIASNAYVFTGANQMLSQTTMSASTGMTYTAWFRFSYGGDIILDCRQSGATSAFGQAFMVRGLAVNSLNFLHVSNPPRDTAVFTAIVVDNSAQIVTLRMASGGEFSTVTGHYRSILFSGQPDDGDTLTVDGVIYTFRSSPSLGNDIQIGTTTSSTVANTQTIVQDNSMALAQPGGGDRLIMARSDIGSFSVSSGSASITVETGIPLDGGVFSVGRSAISSSSLYPFSGELFEARVYNSALSLANITYLHNAMAGDFGYNDIAGTSTAPDPPLLIVDPLNPNPAEFPSLGEAAYCVVVDENTLRIHGEASASVELPYGANGITINYKLDATPTGDDKYVIASFGTVESPIRLYIAASNPTKLYANDREVMNVAAPTNFNTLLVDVYTNKIRIGSFEHYFSGKPRCYLGNAFPEDRLSASKTVDYDVSAMSAVQST